MVVLSISGTKVLVPFPGTVLPFNKQKLDIKGFKDKNLSKKSNIFEYFMFHDRT